MTGYVRLRELWNERKFHFARFVERAFPERFRGVASRFLNLRRLTINLLDWGTRASLPLGPRGDTLVRASFVAPNRLQNLSEKEAVPGLRAHIVEEVRISVNRRGGFAVDGDTLLTRGTWTPALPKLHYANSSVAGEVFQQESIVYQSILEKSSRLEKGIYVGSFAPHNWFHWLIDTLPSVFFLKDLPPQYLDYPIILPTGTLSKGSWSEAFELVNPGHLVAEVSPDGWHGVGELLMLDGVTNGFPRPVALSSWNPRIAIRSRALHVFRENILAQVSSRTENPARFPERIFVGRRGNTERSYNQDELADIARRYGFTLVFLEDYSFVDSVALFQHAKYIIGPHGAGFANVLFAAPRAKILFWSWEDSRGDNWYENLFFFSGADVERIVVSLGSENVQHRDPRNSSYIIDPQLFRAKLVSVLKN